MASFFSSALLNKNEYLHAAICSENQLYVCWNVHDWRYDFVQMVNRDYSDSTLTYVRLIGWQEYSQNGRKELNYLDTMVMKDQHDLFISCLPYLDTYIVEIGVGIGDRFFPILQSELLHFEGNLAGKCASLQHEKWKTSSVKDENWHTLFSTYTYYESKGEV